MAVCRIPRSFIVVAALGLAGCRSEPLPDPSLIPDFGPVAPPPSDLAMRRVDLARTDLATRDCRAGFVCPPGRVCDRATGACEQCLADSDCTVPGLPSCELGRRVCVECVRDDDCPLGALCVRDRCAAGPLNCPAGLTLCGGVCVDVLTDFKNCGACGLVCAGGWNCCQGTCSNPARDARNCGACGFVCSLTNATACCVARRCTVCSCNPGWGDCNADDRDGCEVDLTSDTRNCGNCGSSCLGFRPCVGAMCL